MLKKLIIISIIVFGVALITGCDFIKMRAKDMNQDNQNVFLDKILISFDSVNQRGNIVELEIFVEAINKRLSGKYIISLDIYPTDEPRHPDRHWGFWNLIYDDNKLNSINVDLDTINKDAKLTVDNKALIPGKDFSFWKGKISEGNFQGFLAIWNQSEPEHRKVFKVFDFSVESNRLNQFNYQPFRQIIDF